MATITLTQQDAGTTVDVAVGDHLDIRLPETPTSGHRWAVEPLEGGALEPAGSAFEPGDGLGAGGMRTFGFDAVRPGTAAVSLKRWREWEGEPSVQERFAATVTVTQR